MAHVFLSYDREDAARARLIALALEKAGHSVWWDRHIKGGAQYSKEIERELSQADAVVVLWSARSVESAWVRDEAAAGRDSGRLVPVALDSTDPPLGFRQYQTIDLSARKRGRGAQHAELLRAIDALDGKAGAAAARLVDESAAAGKRRRRLAALAAAFAAIGAIAAVLIWWSPWAQRSSASVVAVVPSEQSAGARTLARDLLVQLGSLQAINADALKLVAAETEKPDLVLEVSAIQQGREATAGLVLFAAKDRTLLWSQDYRQPIDRLPDLRQQLAYSAAQVLRCAGEAMSASGTTLNEDTRSLYLKGCAELARSAEDVDPVVTIFERVVGAAPRFRPAWEKLLRASTQAASVYQPFADSTPDDRLRRHIAATQRLFPDLPELRLARLPLLPVGAFADRVKLADEAKRLAPANPYVLTSRSQVLMHIGRMGEAEQDAERAVHLDPLSPLVRDAFISILAYSGSLGRAEEALNEAERLWPGTASVLDVKLRYHLRYGDPRIALGILRQHGTSRLHEAFLLARIDPSPENVEKAVRQAYALFRKHRDISIVGQTLAQFGRDEELYSTLAGYKGDLADAGFDVFFRPTFKKFREDPRFVQLAHRAGLVDYWRKSGKWPDFCFEPDLPYDCKAEAAKLAV